MNLKDKVITAIGINDDKTMRETLRRMSPEFRDVYMSELITHDDLLSRPRLLDEYLNKSDIVFTVNDIEAALEQARITGYIRSVEILTKKLNQK